MRHAGRAAEGAAPDLGILLRIARQAATPLVPPGSYVVMEETIVNGHPVWPSFGPGPFEAARHLLAGRDDFVPDPDLERSGLTFNPQGFLKRVR